MRPSSNAAALIVALAVGAVSLPSAGDAGRVAGSGRSGESGVFVRSGARAAHSMSSFRSATAVQRIVVDLAHPLASFSPEHALGGALDGHEQGETAQIYTPANERAMKSAGLDPVSYRLRTELGVAAWHWNPTGTWSDPRHHDGYWTSSPAPGRPFLASYGYGLSRRGDTRDQAEDDGYSRLDDGSLGTFWKSNPYLDPFYTHEAHPQWVLVDFGWRHLLDAVRIAWGTPYARSLRVQWWQGPEALFQAGHAPGCWRDFPRFSFAGHPGAQTLILARRAISTRFIRVLMTHSSHTALAGSHDVRDRLGYAIRELYAGRIEHNHFVDLMHHGIAHQTVTYASSTDPWHAASTLDRKYEQPSFTTVLRSGLARGLSMLVPVPVLYGTPRDAIEELRYLRALHVPISGVELGEEPNGQYASPEDYGALYLQFARAIHRDFPTLRLGGPGYETSIPDWLAWPDAHGDRSWTRRFVDYLRAHHALDLFSFFSFEWYPFDDGCLAPGPQLDRNAATLAAVMRRQSTDGLPPGIPRIITEYGYSAFAAEDEVDLAGAVLDADTAAEFLALGGDSTYLYGYEPAELMSELPKCGSWGNLTLFQENSAHRIQAPVAAYWGTRLVTQSWAQPGAAPNVMLASTATGAAPVAAYALRRPDDRLSILLLNKDPGRARSVTIDLTGAGPLRALTGAVSLEQLSRAQYVWHPAGERGYAHPDGPPARSIVNTGAQTELSLPPLSITVMRTESPLS